MLPGSGGYIKTDNKVQGLAAAFAAVVGIWPTVIWAIAAPSSHPNGFAVSRSMGKHRHLNEYTPQWTSPLGEIDSPES